MRGQRCKKINLTLFKKRLHTSGQNQRCGKPLVGHLGHKAYWMEILSGQSKDGRGRWYQKWICYVPQSNLAVKWFYLIEYIMFFQQSLWIYWWKFPVIGSTLMSVNVAPSCVKEHNMGKKKWMCWPLGLEQLRSNLELQKPDTAVEGRKHDW